LKNANCFDSQKWTIALTSAKTLETGACGLSDGSTAGQWRLPSIKELQSLMDRSRSNPALPAGHPFSGVAGGYWSSSTYANYNDYAWYASMHGGFVKGSYTKTNNNVWPVRAGKCFNTAGAEITCDGTSQDGAAQRGVASHNPRFTDNGNGTVTDKLTRLVWLKNANCFGSQMWATAINLVNSLATGACGLTDSSAAGQWRLPNIKELQSLMDRSRGYPTLPAGYPFSYPFSDIQADGEPYWSSSFYAYSTDYAWVLDEGNEAHKQQRGAVYIDDGNVNYLDKSNYFSVWPVRSGK
jgi:hypothetical protein